jgi:hypothetical protein
VKAIETRYAGCHFRSRLEARWAVCFDRLGIRWEYEREGYLCSPRLSGGWIEEDVTIPYLPDFWFPDYGVHGEVKATLTDDELLKLLDCAASLSSNDGGGCHDNGGHDLVVFGKIPDHGVNRTPTRLHMHKGDLNASAWERTVHGCWDGQTVASDYGGDLKAICHHTPRIIAEWLTGGVWGTGYTWEPGYAAARSARFEHGQSGAT